MQRISELILKHHRGELSVQEEEELQRWRMERPGMQELFRDLTEETRLKRLMEEMDGFSEAAVREKVEARRPNTFVPVPVIPLYHHSRSRWIAAAAIILVLSGLGGWWMIRSHHPAGSLPVATGVARDIQPGGNRAVLTLYGGQQIVLDSARPGSLAMQGISQVVKADSGRLVYRSRANMAASAVLYNTLSTPRGGQYQLSLSDGTRVWLNAASSITFPTTFSGKERKVTITGEAYLEVAARPDQPFIVSAGGMDISVLGTSFNINAYQDETNETATLVEGKIRVGGAGRTLVMTAGQQARSDKGTHLLSMVSHPDIGQALAWKNGYFSFTDADLPSVMRQLSRWYDINVVYEGNIRKADYQFNGEMGKNLSLSMVLDILAQSRIHYSIEPGNKLVIRP